MSELPKGWGRAPLSKLCDKIVDGSHNPAPPNIHGRPMLSARNILNNELDLKEFRRLKDEDFVREDARTRVSPGDVLLTIVGTIGRSYALKETDESFTLQRSVAVLHPLLISPQFCAYQFQSPRFQESLRDQARGTAQKGVYLKTLSALEIVVAPLSEQDRIVAEIEKQFSRLDAATAALKRVRTNLMRYRASVLKAACEGRLVPTEAELARSEGRGYEPADKLLEHILHERRAHWEAETLAKMIASGNPPNDDRWKRKYKEPSAPETPRPADFPEGWTWTTLEAVADAVDPQPSHRTPPEVADGIPYIGMGDITKAGQIDRDNARKVSMFVLAEHRERYQLQAGDFFIGKIGTIGNPVRAEEPFDYTLSANVVLIQPRGCPLLFWYMSTAAFSHLLAEGSRATTQAAFGIQKMRLLPCPVPPLQEQYRILSELEKRMSVIDRLVGLVSTELARSPRLRQAILKNAFEGRLTPQNPNDESASVLLERIRSERNSTVAKTPKESKRQGIVHV
jgi:type I restriction enzyme S subunit